MPTGNIKQREMEQHLLRIEEREIVITIEAKRRIQNELKKKIAGNIAFDYFFNLNCKKLFLRNIIIKFLSYYHLIIISNLSRLV